MINHDYYIVYQVIITMLLNQSMILNYGTFTIENTYFHTLEITDTKT